MNYNDLRNIQVSPLKVSFMRNLKLYQNQKRVQPRDLRYSSSHLDERQQQDSNN